MREGKIEIKAVEGEDCRFAEEEEVVRRCRGKQCPVLYEVVGRDRSINQLIKTSVNWCVQGGGGRPGLGSTECVLYCTQVLLYGEIEGQLRCSLWGRVDRVAVPRYVWLKMVCPQHYTQNRSVSRDFPVSNRQGNLDATHN